MKGRRCRRTITGYYRIIVPKEVETIKQSPALIKVSHDSGNNADASLNIGANDKYVEQFIPELNLSIYSKQYQLSEMDAVEKYESQLEIVNRLKIS